MGPQDHGDYHCVSKNELGITKGVFHVQGLCACKYCRLIASSVSRAASLAKRIIRIRAHLAMFQAGAL